MRKLLLFMVPALLMSCNINNPFQKFEGTYIAKDALFYKSFTFKGESTVIIKDNFLGFDFISSYEKDGDYIRVKANMSDLLLKIVTVDSLVGEGFAKGNYIKLNYKELKTTK